MICKNRFFLQTEEIMDTLFETKTALQRNYSRLRLVVIGLVILQLVLLVGIGIYLGGSLFIYCSMCIDTELRDTKLPLHILK